MFSQDKQSVCLVECLLEQRSLQKADQVCKAEANVIKGIEYDILPTFPVCSALIDLFPIVHTHWTLSQQREHQSLRLMCP
jgi:hypothetical protein